MELRRLALLGAALGTALFSSLGLAQSPCEPMVARLVSAQGKVEARADATSAWRPAALNAVFCPGHMVRVGAQSRAALILNNDTILRLDQHTTLTLSGVENGELSWLDLLSGIAHFISRVPRALTVKTPFVNAAVEGTEFVVAVAGNEARVTVFEGRVWAQNEAGRLVLDSGQTAVAQAGQAPVARVVVRPRDAVQWALYYPPIFDRRLAQAPPAPWQKAVANSLNAYYAGDTVKAFAAIENVPEPSEARYFTHRAALHLIVGRVEEARADIERARQLDAQNAHAIALQSVIALAQNEKDRAFALAHQASELDPISVPALVALSYAQQGLFDIAAATMSMERAIAQDREDPLVWARLAELHLSQGDLDRALNAAQAAVALNPRSAHAQSMLGFAYLTRIEIDSARRAFEQSIAYDSTFPLARLGLGLAIIRTGDLAAGRREIEIAAALDPLNSLIRSYLGKAYYEEKRDHLAGSQLAMAKSLDDKDPTPWFYDAIRKQTINRPVEALHDLRRSIELNDHRAVYRSRLLMDQDLAARSVSLARIYNDLDFSQRALVEGWQSVNTDPSNYSAHQLLADSYATLPRHGVARVSERLQAQLLAPLSLNPVRPQSSHTSVSSSGLTGSSALAFLDHAGPSATSFNEFNPLFVRNRISAQINGLYGGDDTWGDDFALSGLQGPFAYSVGQFHYETGGWRENSDQEQDIYSAFAQLAISEKTNIQVEYRSGLAEAGDINNPYLNVFSPTLRSEFEFDTLRLGVHNTFNSHSDFILSAISQSENVFADDPVFFPAPAEGKEDGDIIEAQSIYNSENLDLITGGGAYDAEFESPPSIPLTDTSHDNYYLYSSIKYFRNLTLILGASKISWQGLFNTKRDQNNPKFGLIWAISPNTTLRLAGFRVLKQNLVANQTIEPTQVAGFNQFFDDDNGTESRRYGVALDHVFSRSVYGGLEATRREIMLPPDYNDDPYDEKERFDRAYLYWTPTNSLALSTEYSMQREIDAGTSDPDLETHMISLGLGIFSPPRFTTRFKVTYVDHEVFFQSSPIFPTFQRDTDKFWIADVSISYWLPKRRGIISFGVKNLFNEEFLFKDDSESPLFYPKRLVFGRLSLAI